MKKGKAKRLVMQRQYRSQVARDKTKYRRKSKHRKAPDFGGFSVFGRIAMTCPSNILIASLLDLSQ
ncbi:DUF7230 family protein [Thiolapillus sp.]